MELKVGDYVKTEKGEIYHIEHDEILKFLSKSNYHKIIKSSPNIIDLIEVGDLIKLKPTKQIQQVLSKNENEISLTDYVFYDLKKSNVVEEIEWIITREQIEQMKYKIGG